MPTGGNDNVVREIGRNAKSASDEDFDVDGDLKDGEKRAGDGVKVGGGSALGEVEMAPKELEAITMMISIIMTMRMMMVVMMIMVSSK